jgi:hypothetical protein
MKSMKEMIEGELWYATSDGFKFPVPIADVRTGVFNAEDKAILFMRWIRKQIDVVEKAALESKTV